MKNKWRRLTACLVAITLIATFTVTAFAGDQMGGQPGVTEGTTEGTTEGIPQNAEGTDGVTAQTTAGTTGTNDVAPLNGEEGGGGQTPDNGDGIEAAAAVTADDLMRIYPSLMLSTDTSLGAGNYKTGQSYTATLAGSINLSGGKTLNGVEFYIRTDPGVVMEAYAGDNHKLELLDGTGTYAKFTYLRPVSENGARSFGSFGFHFNGDGSIANSPAPDGQMYGMTIEKVVCGAAEVYADVWQGSSFGNILSVGMYPVAANTWKFVNMAAATQNLTVSRFAGKLKDVQDFEVAANTDGAKFLFTLKSQYSAGTIPTVGYENLSAYAMVAKMTLDTGLLMPKVATDNLKKDAFTLVYDGAYKFADFEKYFKFNNADLGQFNVSAKLDAEDAKVIYFEFTPKAGADITKLASFNPTIEMPWLYLSAKLTDAEHIAKVSMAYVDADSYYKSIGSDAAKAFTEAKGTYAQLTVKKAESMNEVIKPSLEKITKKAQEWSYSILTAGDNLGQPPSGNTAGWVSRSFVSNYAITVKDGESIDVKQKMNRVWFYWDGLAGLEIPAQVDKVTLSEKSGDSYDAKYFRPIGFMVPGVGNAGSATADYVITIKLSSGETYTITSTNGVIDYATFAAAGKFDIVDNKAVLKNAESGAYIDSIDFAFTAVTAGASYKVAGTPAVLFMATPEAETLYKGLKEGETLELTNTSKVATVIDKQDGPSATQQCGVPYIDAPDDLMTGGKTVKSLSKDKPTDGTTVGHSKGDLLEYTLTMGVPAGNKHGYVDGLWIMDESTNLELADPMKVNIVISNKNGSTMTYDNAAGVVGTGTITYTGVYPTLRSWKDATAAAKYGLDPAKQQMLFCFSGKLVEGDTVTITYQGKAAADYNAATEAGKLVTNKMEYKTFTKDGETDPTDPTDPDPGPGPGPGPGKWEGKEGGKTSIKVTMPMLLADVMTTLTYKGTTTGAGFVLPGKDLELTLKGGLIGSDKKAENPAWMLYISDNLKVTGLANSLAFARVELKLSGSTWSRNESAISPSVNPVFSYYDVDGNEITGLTAASTAAEFAEVRYVRLDVPGYTLDVDQIASFKVPVASQYVASITNDNQKTARGYFFGGADLGEKLFQQQAGNTGWGGRGIFDANSPASLKKVATKDGTITPVNGYMYALQSRPITVYQFTNVLDLAKETSPTTVPLGAENTYTVAVANKSQTYVNSAYAEKYLLDYVVDVLPAGQSYKAGSLKYGTAAKGDDLVATDYVTISGVKHQRLVFTVNTSINYNASLAISYKTTLDSLDSLDAYNLSDEESQAEAYNYASIYYDPAKTSLVAGSTTAANKDDDSQASEAVKAQWRTGIPAALNGLSRIETNCKIILKAGKIAPGITKTLVTKPEAAGSFTGMPKLEWKIDLYNTGEQATGKAQVVDILPKGYVFDAMTGTNKTEPTQYINHAGNVVLVWNYDALANKTSATATLQFRIIPDPDKDINIVGTIYNHAYLLLEETGENLFTSQDIAKSGSTALGEYIPAGDGTRLERTQADAEGTLPEGIYSWRGVYANATARLLSSTGAGAEKAVTNTTGATVTSSDLDPIEIQRGDKLSYSYSMDNSSSTGNTMDAIVMYDRLPAGVDDGYVILGEGRGSAWGPDMAGAFSVSGQDADKKALTGFEDYEVYYSAKVAGDIEGWQDDAAMQWVKAGDWTGSELPASFRIVFPADFSLMPNESLTVNWEMEAPADLIRPLNDTVAWNSASYSFKSNKTVPFVIEPEKVGVRLMSEDGYLLTVNKVYNDSRAGAGNATFRFILEKWTGSSWQPFDLTHMDITGLAPAAGATGEFTLNARPNQTASGTIGGLTAGSYRVREIGDLSDYTVDNDKRVTVGEGTPEAGVSVTITNDRIVPVVPPTEPEDPTDPDDPDDPGAPVTPVVPAVVPPALPGAPVVIAAPPVVVAGPVPGTIALGPIDNATTQLDNQVPLGNLDAVGWSLLNLIMALVAIFDAIVLLITLFGRRKKTELHREAYYDEDGHLAYHYVDENGEEPDKPERYRLAALKVPALLLGLIPGILLLLLENIRLPMTWITQWTPLIGAFFIIHMVVLIVQVVVRKRQEEKETDEDDLTNAPA